MESDIAKREAKAKKGISKKKKGNIKRFELESTNGVARRVKCLEK